MRVKEVIKQTKHVPIIGLWGAIEPIKSVSLNEMQQKNRKRVKLK
jgi:hypothetical protein